MRHYLDIENHLFTDEYINQFVIDDAKTINWIDTTKHNMFNPELNQYITEEAYNKYMNANKIYYMHLYDTFYFTSRLNLIPYDKCIIPIIFLYNKDQSYHIYTLSTAHKSALLLTDITYRLNYDYDFWKLSYFPEKFKPTVVISDTIDDQRDVEPILCFYDTKNEAIEAAIKYFNNYLKHCSSVMKTELLIYNTDYTYERLFNQIYEDRIKNLKDEITKELSDNKQNLIENININTKQLENISKLANEYNIKI